MTELKPYDPLALYIDGRFIGADERDGEDVLCPATGAVIGRLPHATKDDLNAALLAAEHAFVGWRWTSPLERGRVLRRVADLIRERHEVIARNITLDQGKPLAESRAEVFNAAEHAEWHAEECRRIYGRTIPSRDPRVHQSVIRQPIGVCVAFTPWNFPFNQALRKICAALGAGCTLILKGAEDAPSAVVALARLFHEAGLPAGCLNLVWGNPSEISEALIRSPITRKVSFTGSVPVGKHLAATAGSQMKRMTMELGGHAPVIVFNDADIDHAALTLARLKTLNAGQVCMSPSRFYVQAGVHDAFVEKFSAAYSSVIMGDGLAPATTMGPLTQQRRVSAIDRLVTDAIELGADLVTGGVRSGGPGFFYPPTVLTEIPDTARLMNEEPFGPVVPVSRFSTFEDVIKRANELPFGLASYVFTRSLEFSHRASIELEAGMVGVNHFGLALPETPLGGVKDSGVGSEGGSETFDAYLTTKYISKLAVL